jgi:hypothetical protein
MRIAIAVCVLLFGETFAITPASAQSTSNPGFGVGGIHKDLVVGAIVGIAAVAGAGTAFLVFHKRGVAVGCVVESGGKRTLTTSGKKVYTLVDAGSFPPTGERVKVKSHGPGPAFHVEKVLKDYGPCHTGV